MFKYRLISYADISFHTNLLAKIAKYKDVVNEILFNPKPFGKFENIKKWVNKLAPIVELYKQQGIKVSVEIVSRGHGYDGDYSSVGTDIDSSFCIDQKKRIVKGQFCWYDTKIRQYESKVIQCIVTNLKPYALYFDDEMRIRNYMQPISCFCPRCIEKFNKENNSSYTIDELTYMFEHNIDNIGETYIDFACRGLADYASYLTEVVQKSSPNTLVGLEHGGYA